MKKLCMVMERAVEEGVFPGAVLLADIPGRPFFCRAFGRARLAPAVPVTEDTVFDLASLTKPLALAATFMALADMGRISFCSSLGEALPGLAGSDKKDLKMSWLLAHCAGFPAWKPYHSSLTAFPLNQRRQELAKLIAHEPLEYEPKTQTLYSDIDYMALGLAVEQAGGQALDALARELIYKPLGIDDELFFVDPAGARPVGRVFAATAPCTQAGEIQEGVVNDENARALGGVAGHAGLFGTARGVWRLLRELLCLFQGGAGEGIIRPATAKTFLSRKEGQGTFVLGFDTPRRPSSRSGRHFSDSSVGHLGFTGTSFWMDLEKGAIVILLSNRVFCNSGNEAIKAFRPVIHDAAMEW